MQISGGNVLTEKMFLRAEEVAEVLDVSMQYAYKLMRELNTKLKKNGYFTIAGRIDRKYFYEQFYSARAKNREG